MLKYFILLMVFMHQVSLSKGQVREGNVGSVYYETTIVQFSHDSTVAVALQRYLHKKRGGNLKICFVRTRPFKGVEPFVVLALEDMEGKGTQESISHWGMDVLPNIGYPRIAIKVCASSDFTTIKSTFLKILRYALKHKKELRKRAKYLNEKVKGQKIKGTRLTKEDTELVRYNFLLR